MDEIEDFLENLNIKKYLFNIIIIISFCLLSYFVIYKLNNFDKKINDKVVLNKNISKEKKKDNVEYVIVDIKGEVASPGVYELIKGSRVIDVINEAQGLTNDANTRYINLSKILEDGDAIVIYSNKEIEDAADSLEELINRDKSMQVNKDTEHIEVYAITCYNCPKCNKEIQIHTNYCPYCGQKLDWSNAN